MTQDEWHQLKAVLQAAWEVDAEERAGILDQVGVQDVKLRSTVEALLACDRNAGDFLATPAFCLTIDLRPEDFDDQSIGRPAGPYRILGVIGHGGMGTVYLAERADGQYEKQVAIKFVTPQFGGQFLRRFLRERQVLATLDHPNIARLLDGGETTDGLPYLVMDYVEGEHIDTWCESRQVPVRDRLRLFQSVCAAVQYAHEKHVIHRDIKPGNIVVTADGIPKLLDFGVAKVLNPEPSGDTREITLGPAPITPEYASPEQARGERVGPAADVYALGVLLYRLLTGRLPYVVQGGDPGRKMRAICEQEPMKPSAVTQDRQVTRDLDSIILKAMRKEPDRRYASVAELSNDLDRFLLNRPIRARKDSLLYRARKFLTRHQSPVMAAALTAVLLLALLAVNRSAGPGRPHSPASGKAAPNTTNREAMRAYEEGRSERARFQRAATYKALQRAIDLDPQFLMAHYSLADAMQFWGNLSEARRVIARAHQLAEHSQVSRLQKLLVEALRLRQDLYLEEAAAVLETAHREFALETEPLVQLAYIRSLQGRFAETATLLEEVKRIDPRHALAQIRLAYAYAYQGYLTRALACIDQYGALLPPGPGNEVPFWARAEIYMINERYDEAISEYRAISYRDHIVRVAIHKGDDALAESTLNAYSHRRRMWYSVAGDLAVSRGDLDRAVIWYEEAVKQYQSEGPLRPWWALLTAARIFLEQRQPEGLLALGRRHTTPWAAGLRGTARLLLHEELDAEKEFAAMRSSITQILGAEFADKAIEFHRMLAASYSGHFDQVIQMWPALPRSFWSAYALDVGRAYLRAGLFTEAEHHLRSAQMAQRAFFMDMDKLDQHNSLTWMLAQFYLGQVQEKTGRHNEAIANYQSFLKHFARSSAQLPQIAVARAVLERFQLSERGRLIFGDDLSGNGLQPGWEDTSGNWAAAGGIAKVSERPQGHHQTVRRHALTFHDGTVELLFRLNDAREITLSVQDRSGYAGGLSVTPTRMALTLSSNKSNTLDEFDSDRFASFITAIEPDKWHKAVFEIRGKRMIAQLDDGHMITRDSTLVDVDKAGIKLSVSGGTASLDYLRVYEISTRKVSRERMR